MNRGRGRASQAGSVWAVFSALLLAVVGLASLLASGSEAQQAPSPPASQNPPPKLKVESKLVYVNAVVRDKKGKIVPTLNKEDFILDEEGHPQTITNFIRESDLPLTLGLLVDTSMSQRHVLDSEREASYTFLDQMLRVDKDKAFLIHFDHEVELLQDLTADRAKLKSSLKLLQTADYQRTSDDEDGQGHGHHRAGTLLYDAIYLASNELMKKQQGRKALFILSDGVDRGSRESLEDAIESAQRADTAVYSILFPGEEGEASYAHHGGWGMGGPGMGGPRGYPGGGYPGGGGGGGGGGQRSPREEHPDGKKVLEQISTETGGRLFQISKKLSISDVYAQVQEELRNQYTLGYTPDRANQEPGYHKIHLATKETDLTVQARDGYYSD